MKVKVFKKMVKEIRDVESSLGQINYIVSEKDKLRKPFNEKTDGLN